MVQWRLCYLLLASEKIFFKWKQIKGEQQSCGSGLLFPLTRAKRQAWGSLFKSCQWHSFMLMYYKSLRAHARFHVFIWISDVKDPVQLLTQPASDKPGCWILKYAISRMCPFHLHSLNLLFICLHKGERVPLMYCEDKSHKKEIKHRAYTRPSGTDRARSLGWLFSPKKGSLPVETITDKTAVVKFAWMEEDPIE